VRFDCVDWVKRFNGPTGILVRVDKNRKHVEHIPIRRTNWRTPKAIDRFERCGVILV
jgi:hypothetical protein